MTVRETHYAVYQQQHSIMGEGEQPKSPSVPLSQLTEERLTLRPVYPRPQEYKLFIISSRSGRAGAFCDLRQDPVCLHDIR